MQVQEFILKHGLDALTEQLGITVKRYDNGYVKLNYSQIESPKFHPVADVCRGLTLLVNPDNTSTVVSRSFPRFYNLGEGSTKDFDFSDCTVQEKADGSLVEVFYSPLDHKWCISTRGMTYAEGNFTFSLTASGGTFNDWILKAMRLSEEQLQECMSVFAASYTYVMEYVAPENRIVTRYPEAQMVLLAVIHNETGRELTNLEGPCKIFQSGGMNIRPVNTFPANSGAELVKLANSLPGLQEGFVVVNNKTRDRVKIKSETYVRVHQLRGEGVPSMSRLMELVLTNETSEVITYFPEFVQYVTPIEQALERLLANAEELYAAHQHIDNQKEFALLVKDSPVAPLMFKTRGSKQTVRHTFAQLDLNVQSRLLEKFLNDY